MGIDLSLNSTAITCKETHDSNFVVYFFTQTKSLASKFDNSFYLPKNLVNLSRLDFVYSKIKEILIKEEPEYVAIEDYSYGSIGQHFSIGELGGIIKLLIVKEFEIPLRLYKPTQIKQFVTGKGNSPKSIMLTAIYKKYKVDFSKYETAADDVADSYGIMRMLSTELKLREEVTKAKGVEKSLFTSELGYCNQNFITLRSNKL